MEGINDDRFASTVEYRFLELLLQVLAAGAGHENLK